MAQVVCNCKPVIHHHRDCLNYLVNARHNTEHIVVGRIDAYRRAEVRAYSVVADREEERRVIDTR